MHGHACLSRLSSPPSWLANIRHCVDAGTSLHHSTLATESSPDSSPLASAHGGGYPIPRGGSYYRPLDSPIGYNHYHHGSSHAASSLGSASMLDYVSADDSDSSSDGDLDLDFDLMDTAPVSNTPAAAAAMTTASAASAAAAASASTTTAATMATAMELAASSLLNHQKARFGARYNNPPRFARNRPMMTPSPVIQPHSPKFGGSNGGGNGGGNGGNGSASGSGSGFEYAVRRNSISLGPSALEYEAYDVADRAPGDRAGDRPTDPVRRPVSRRGSLLPKTKNFQRIKAALIEEASPIELEVRREAEITRQIREEDSPQSVDTGLLANIGEDERADTGDCSAPSASASTSASVPASQKGGVGTDTDLERRMSFSWQAERHGGGFWFGGGSADQMDGLGRSPPPFPGSLRMGGDGDIIVFPPASSFLNKTNGIDDDGRWTRRR